MSKPIALIIEDDPQLSQVFTLTLANDFQCEAIQDGQTAMNRLAETTPDLVVLDLHLPNVAGKTILTYIRSEPRLSRVRVFLATADDLRARELEDKADIILLKPISPLQLRELANRLFARNKNP